MKVEQFLNRNQFRLYDLGINILQSYNSKVVEITNKRKYINDLLKECERDKDKFYKENHYIIVYDERMV